MNLSFAQNTNNKYDAAEYYALGKTYAAKGMRQKEIECYKKAIELKPDFAEAHYELAIAYGSEEEKAIAEYKKALEIKPDFVNVHFMLGAVYFKKAKEHFKRAQELGQKLPQKIAELIEN